MDNIAPQMRGRPFWLVPRANSQRGRRRIASERTAKRRVAKSLKTGLANPPHRDYAPRSFFGNLAVMTVVALLRVRKDFIYGS